MSKEERELVEKFGKLTPENKHNALSIIRAALAAQENTIKSMSRPSDKKPKRKTA